MTIDCEIQRGIDALGEANKKYQKEPSDGNEELILLEMRFLHANFANICDWAGHVDEKTRNATLEAMDESCDLLTRSRNTIARFIIQMRRE